MKIRMAQLFTTHMLPEKHMYIPMEACMHMLPGKRMYIPMVLCIPMRMAMDIIITMRIRRRS